MCEDLKTSTLPGITRRTSDAEGAGGTHQWIYMTTELFCQLRVCNPKCIFPSRGFTVLFVLLLLSHCRAKIREHCVPVFCSESCPSGLGSQTICAGELAQNSSAVQSLSEESSCKRQRGKTLRVDWRPGFVMDMEGCRQCREQGPHRAHGCWGQDSPGAAGPVWGREGHPHQGSPALPWTCAALIAQLLAAAMQTLGVQCTAEIHSRH